MTIDKVLVASADLAKSICDCMDGVRNTNPDLDPIYGVCLVVADDYDYLAVYANTEFHFAQSEGGMLDKWQFADWWSEGMDIETDALMENLGQVDDIDETPENDQGPFWLTAMTNAMRLAKNQNAFQTKDVEPFLFCSMIDSANAVWLEEVSARFLNTEESYNKLAPEIAAAQSELYSGATGRQEYKTAYENLLRQL